VRQDLGCVGKGETHGSCRWVTVPHKSDRHGRWRSKPRVCKVLCEEKKGAELTLNDTIVGGEDVGLSQRLGKRGRLWWRRTSFKKAEFKKGKKTLIRYAFIRKPLGNMGGGVSRG